MASGPGDEGLTVTEQWMIALTIVVAAAIIQGLTGFGFGLFSMPLLSLLYGPHQAVIIVLLLGSLAGTLMTIRLRGDVDASRLARYLVIGLLAMPLGVALYHALDASAMQLIVGITVTIVAVTMLLGPRVKLAESLPAEYGSVFAGGAMTAATGMGAAPVVLYAALARIEKVRFRVTLTAYGVAASLTAILALWSSGAVTSGDLSDSLRLVVGLLLGLPVGMRLHGHISERGFERFVLAALLLMGIAGIVRTL